MSLGQKIKKLREDSNLTQEELGKILNVSKPTVSRYEADTNEPNTDTLKKLAEFFNVTIDFLLDRTSTRNSYNANDKNIEIKTLGAIISEYREKNNFSLRDFSDKCGLSHTYIEKLEKGVDPRSGEKIEPTLDTICKIAKALDKSTNELLEETGYIKSDKASDAMFEKANDLIEEYIKNNKNGNEDELRAKGLYTSLILHKLFEDGHIKDGVIDDKYVDVFKAALKTDSKILEKDDK